MFTGSPKIAIVAHMYYDDVCRTLLKKIGNVPVAYDLYVTTPDENLANFVASEAEKLCESARCVIAITPNIGRNFAPFLVEFGKQLQNYDLLCHVHTKKSLHTTSFAGWESYLTNNIIGSPSLIRAIIKMFEVDVNCGLVYPNQFASLPVWAHHWLGNYEIARDWGLLNGIVIDFSDVKFPTGGMFWARPKAICQVLSFPWKYSHFPKEQGQIDGTMHHAIERLIGVVSARNCFHHCIIDPSIGIK